ncbi:MAG: hypothetical protein AB7V14_04140 [Kiritimatiellia bacterium]
MSCSIRSAALAWLLPCLLLPARGASEELVFSGGQIVCEISTAQKALPERVLSTLPIAMNAALEHVGAPAGKARLAIRLQTPPPFYKRAKALFRAEAFAVQEGDEIRLHAGHDPLKLAFRLGHELSHWLAYKRHPVRPPLWLDEGLAQLVGAAAADTCARTRKQTLDRPVSPDLADHLFGLGELTALTAYPRNADAAAAFYWQAEALVGAIRKKLGPADFAVYLGLLSVPDAPDWQRPLRERWYFSDWDVNWLAERIRPDPQNPDVPFPR